MWYWCLSVFFGRLGILITGHYMCIHYQNSVWLIMQVQYLIKCMFYHFLIPLEEDLRLQLEDLTMLPTTSALSHANKWCWLLRVTWYRGQQTITGIMSQSLVTLSDSCGLFWNDLLLGLSDRGWCLSLQPCFLRCSGGAHGWEPQPSFVFAILQQLKEQVRKNRFILVPSFRGFSSWLGWVFREQSSLHKCPLKGWVEGARTRTGAEGFLTPPHFPISICCLS